MTGRTTDGRMAPVAVVWSLALLAGAAFWAAVGTTASTAWSGAGDVAGRLVLAGLLAALSQGALVALWLVASHEVEGGSAGRAGRGASGGRPSVPRPRSGLGVPV